MNPPETQDRSRVRLNVALYAATVICGCVALLLLYLHVNSSDNEVNGTDVVPGAGQDVGRGLVEAVPLASDAEQQRTAAQLEAASKMVTSFVNFDYQDPDRTIEAVKSMATGEFLSQYTKGAADLEKLATEAQSTMVAEVVWTGLVAGDEDTATAIVATSGTVKNKTTDFQPEARNYRIQLELVREGGRWLTKDLQYVALG
ncbi:hypothetical protein [Nocardioides nitrophenolicus]|uniref:hypothetical protein n=1 Tax=Nocardioides nitrophenolicus TaxID=60489 RepID=UPI00195C9424|nr:hypothetical protein [Nocardioides nitrophenolicus]MBM7515158.1 hypothetical protein [Nocardioides nitrophenolicus]